MASRLTNTIASSRPEREPTVTELGIFSRHVVRALQLQELAHPPEKLPTTGTRVLQGPGENAGAVDIGDGLAAVFKIESHNHPSFIEPYQGAATGVGGIIRDIFTMGARPIALLNSLRFGPPDGRAQPAACSKVWSPASAATATASASRPSAARSCFDETYAGNPLVNVLCLGIVAADALVERNASGTGNPVYYVGAKTGRDGIHGATMASAEFDDNGREAPGRAGGRSVHGEAAARGLPRADGDRRVIGVQDMGAAGLTCSTCEMGSRGGAGVEIDVMHVPQRETGMTPYEIMLSESQERMLLVVKKGREAEVEAIFDKWDLHAAHIGEVTTDGLMRVKDHGQGRRRDRQHVPGRRGAGLRPPDQASGRNRRGPRGRPGVPRPLPPQDALLRLLGSPRSRASAGPTGRLRLDGAHQHHRRGRRRRGRRPREGYRAALAMATDGNGRYCYLNPRRGAMLAVAEAARNVACAGGVPIGVTNCLNFGNPERPDIMWQLVEAVEGIAEACRALDLPITGGNVSLYNETDGKAIYPTPVIGVVGLIEDASRVLAARSRGAATPSSCSAPRRELGGSEYLKIVHGLVAGDAPPLDLKRSAPSSRS